MRNYILIVSIILLAVGSCKKKEALVDPFANNIPDIEDLRELERNTDKPGVAFLFFYNVWNEPCAKIRTAVEALALDPEFAQVYFAEIDFDKNPTIARYYAARGFPTILIYRDGVERDRFQGGNFTLDQLSRSLRRELD